MLTPRSDDPNRKEQLAKKEEDPEKFGASHEEKVKQATKAKKDSGK